MQILKNYYAPLTLMILIFIESSIPMDGGPDSIKFLTALDPTFQNLLHIPLYGMLAFLWSQSFQKSQFSNRKMVIMTLFLTILYGCLDEFHQTFVPGRYGGLLDIYLDSIGAVCGIVLFSLYRKISFRIFN